MISKHLAEQGILVVRYNTSGNLNGRIKSLQVLVTGVPQGTRLLSEDVACHAEVLIVVKAILESKHAMLSGVTGWILSGHSMVITTAAVLSLI